MGSFPKRNTFPKPPPIGTAQVLPESASQSAMMIGTEVK
jgi:hypothetical protein